jgi:hypothetical protein
VKPPIHRKKEGAMRSALRLAALAQGSHLNRMRRAALPIGQLVVVALGRVVGEVLDELPVVPVGVVEVDAVEVGDEASDAGIKPALHEGGEEVKQIHPAEFAGWRRSPHPLPSARGFGMTEAGDAVGGGQSGNRRRRASQTRAEVRPC